jgi:subtilisin family serine protease
MLFVVAAGNESQNIDQSPVYPASFNQENILVVASVNSHQTLSKFSNYGINSVDIATPGEFVYSTEPERQYSYRSGTSMATPYVSRVISKLLAIKPSLTPKQIKYILKSTTKKAKQLKSKIKYGGVIDHDKAINYLINRL